MPLSVSLQTSCTYAATLPTPVTLQTLVTLQPRPVKGVSLCFPNGPGFALCPLRCVHEDEKAFLLIALSSRRVVQLIHISGFSADNRQSRSAEELVGRECHIFFNFVFFWFLVLNSKKFKKSDPKISVILDGLSIR